MASSRMAAVAVALLAGNAQASAGEEGAYSTYFDGDYEVLATADDYTFKWIESPLWSESGQYLLFSDVKWEDPNANPPNATTGMIWKYDPATGDVTEFLRSAGIVGPGLPPADLGDYLEAGPNGMIWSWSGDPTLLMNQHGMSRMVQFNVNDVSGGSIDTSKVTVVADRYDGSAFNSPNDMILINGTVLFTDPPFGLQFRGDTGLPQSVDRMPQAEIGIYAVSSPSEEPELILSGHYFPNGIAVPSSGKVFIQHTDFDRPGYSVYDFAGGEFPKIDASSANRFNMTHRMVGENWQGAGGFPALADGNTAHGDVVYAAGPGGVYVLDGESGEEVAFARVNDLVSNVEVGGGYLYITANVRLLRIKLAADTTQDNSASTDAGDGSMGSGAPGLVKPLAASVCLLAGLIAV